MAEGAGHVLLQWEEGDASLLRLEDFRESPQPLSTRIRVLTQSDYAMGVEGQQPEGAASKVPEMTLPAISRDGAFVALPTLRNAWLWSVAAGHPVGALRAGLFVDEGVRPVFTHDGTRLIVADKSGEMRVWRTDGNALDPRAVGLGSQTVKLASTRDGTVLAGTVKGEVFLIGAGASGRPALLHRHAGKRGRCAVSPSGRRGAAIFEDGLVALFDLSVGELKATVSCEKRSAQSVSYEDVDFVGEDHVIAFNGVVPTLIDFTAHAIVARGASDWSQISCSHRPDARAMLVETEAGAVQLVDLPALEVSRTLSVPDGAKVWDFALSPSGKTAAVGLGDGKVLVFDLQTERAPVVIAVDEADSSVDCVAIDGEDRRLAFGTFAGKAGVVEIRKPSNGVWFQAPNLEQATGLPRNNHAHLGIVIDVRFSPDGQRVVTCSGIDGFTRVWQVNGACIEALNTSGVATYARLLDDGRLVNLTEQGEIAFWRVGVRALRDHLSGRTNATLAPTERIRFLSEAPAVAYARYCAAERKRGRTPLPRDFVKIEYR